VKEYGDYLRLKSEKDLEIMNKFNYTLNRIGLSWLFMEMRGKQKFYIRVSKSLPENEKWNGAMFMTFAYLKKK
jgi:hypothetical protein